MRTRLSRGQPIFAPPPPLFPSDKLERRHTVILRKRDCLLTGGGGGGGWEEAKSYEGEKAWHSTVKYSLCTGAFLYAPNRFLLISSKFWMGGRVGGSSNITALLPHPPNPPVQRGRSRRGRMKVGRVRGVKAERAESKGENQWGPSRRGRFGGGRSRRGRIRGGRVRGIDAEGADCSPHPPLP